MFYICVYIYRSRMAPRPSQPAGTGSFPGVKKPERGADHPPPPSAALRMVWNNTASFPLRLHTHVMGWPLPLPRKLIYCTHMGWVIRGSNPSKCKRFSSSTRHLYRLWDPPSFLFNGYRDYFTVVKWPGREVVKCQTWFRHNSNWFIGYD
jgi:hypothetical protein